MRAYCGGVISNIIKTSNINTKSTISNRCNVGVSIRVEIKDSLKSTWQICQIGPSVPLRHTLYSAGRPRHHLIWPVTWNSGPSVTHKSCKNCMPHFHSCCYHPLRTKLLYPPIQQKHQQPQRQAPLLILKRLGVY